MIGTTTFISYSWDYCAPLVLPDFSSKSELKFRLPNKYSGELPELSEVVLPINYYKIILEWERQNYEVVQLNSTSKCLKGMILRSWSFNHHSRKWTGPDPCIIGKYDDIWSAVIKVQFTVWLRENFVFNSSSLEFSTENFMTSRSWWALLQKAPVRYSTEVC